MADVSPGDVRCPRNDGCPCGPRVEAVMRDDGSNGWLYIHHSLDGRELRERDTAS